jgi:rhodanese-related sulfurtransferase
MTQIKAWFLLIMLLNAMVAVAASLPTPAELPGGKIVSLKEAENMVGSGVAVFDVRSAINYGRGHIPGATLVSYKGKSAKRQDFDPELDRFSISLLPENKSTDLLIYSHGITGWKSYKAAITAIRAGYTRVHWLRSGFASWTRAGLPVER